MMDAEQIARALGGKRSGRQYVCKCPAHWDTNPSMLVFDGRSQVQFRCMSGCTPIEIMAALRQRGILGHEIPPNVSCETSRAPAAKSVSPTLPDQHIRAMRIWREARDPRHSPVERYLAQRNIELPAALCGSLIRFHPSCPRGDEFQFALVALMRDIETDEPRAIQRIYLDRNAAKDGKPMMLGPAGGAAMKLTSHAQTFVDELSYCMRLHIGEGLETCLALLQRGYAPIWALGSAGAIRSLPVLFSVGSVCIWADHDPAGISAAEACAERWNAEKNHSAEYFVRETEGLDFADPFGGVDGERTATSHTTT